MTDKQRAIIVVNERSRYVVYETFHVLTNSVIGRSQRVVIVPKLDVFAQVTTFCANEDHLANASVR